MEEKFNEVTIEEMQGIDGGGWGSWIAAAVGVVLCFTPAAAVGYAITGAAIGWDLMDNIFK